MESRTEPYPKEWYYLPLEHRTRSILNLIENKMRSKILLAPKILPESTQKLKPEHIKRNNLASVLKYRPRTPRDTVNYRFIQKKKHVRNRSTAAIETNLHQSLIKALQAEKNASLKKTNGVNESNIKQTSNRNSLKVTNIDSKSKRNQCKKKSRKLDKRPPLISTTSHPRRDIKLRPSPVQSPEVLSPRKFCDARSKVIRRRKISPARTSSPPLKRLFMSTRSSNDLTSSERPDTDTQSAYISNSLNSQISNVASSNTEKCNTRIFNSEAIQPDKPTSNYQGANNFIYNSPLLNENLSVENMSRIQSSIDMIDMIYKNAPTTKTTSLQGKTNNLPSPITNVPNPQHPKFSPFHLEADNTAPCPLLNTPKYSNNSQSPQPISTSRFLPGVRYPMARRPSLTDSVRTPRRLRRQRTRHSTNRVASTSGLNALTKGGAASQPLPEYSLRCIVSAADILGFVTGANALKREDGSNVPTKSTNAVPKAQLNPIHFSVNTSQSAGDSLVVKNDTKMKSCTLPLLVDPQFSDSNVTPKNSLNNKSDVSGDTISGDISSKRPTGIKEKLRNDKLPQIHTVAQDSFQPKPTIKSKLYDSFRNTTANVMNVQTNENDVLDFPGICFKHHYPSKNTWVNDKTKLCMKTIPRSKQLKKNSPSSPPAHSNTKKKPNISDISTSMTVSTIKKAICQMPFKDLQTCLSYSKSAFREPFEFVDTAMSNANSVTNNSNKPGLGTNLESNESESNRHDSKQLLFNKRLPNLPIIELQKRLSAPKTIKNKMKLLAREQESGDAHNTKTDVCKSNKHSHNSFTKLELPKPIHIKSLSSKVQTDEATLDKVPRRNTKLSKCQMSYKNENMPPTRAESVRRKRSISRQSQQYVLDYTQRMDETIRLLYRKKKKSLFPSKKSKPSRNFKKRNIFAISDTFSTSSTALLKIANLNIKN